MSKPPLVDPEDVTDQTNFHFPLKLHLLLEKLEKRGQEDIVSWLPDGGSFKVHDRDRFLSDILPMYFNTSKYKSFQRNLNLWGFNSVPKGPNRGVISHPNFLRGKRDLCRKMKRVAVKKSKAIPCDSSHALSPSLPKSAATAGISSSTPPLENAVNLSLAGAAPSSLEVDSLVDLLRRTSGQQAGAQIMPGLGFTAGTQPMGYLNQQANMLALQQLVASQQLQQQAQGSGILRALLQQEMAQQAAPPSAAVPPAGAPATAAPAAPVHQQQAALAALLGQAASQPDHKSQLVRLLGSFSQV